MRKGERRAEVETRAAEGSLGEKRNDKRKDRVHVSEWDVVRKC